VSVNVSTRQLVESDMVAVVSEALADTGLPADALWLEITESVMMSDTLETLASLTGLRELGAHLSVDDFGTGYSSLSYLQRYPIEQVKVDRQFVTGLCDRPEDAAVVAAIVGMADALNLSWVAEGVERADQAAHLCELGCELVQGYLYSKPVPAIDLGPILLARNEVGHPPAPGSLRH
jgi:EAL domain-containing protein (putative c-di-GMP-specific phosphodiesterase class I)